jgi:hypothetical protein
MAFTQADIDAIDQAMVALATGTRTGTVQIGAKTMSFADTTLSDLRALREVVVSIVASDTAGAGGVPLRVYAGNGGRG